MYVLTLHLIETPFNAFGNRADPDQAAPVSIQIANSAELAQTPCSTVSGLVLHSLPMSHKKDTRLKWVNLSQYFI